MTPRELAERLHLVTDMDKSQIGIAESLIADYKAKWKDDDTHTLVSWRYLHDTVARAEAAEAERDRYRQWLIDMKDCRFCRYGIVEYGATHCDTLCDDKHRAFDTGTKGETK